MRFNLAVAAAKLRARLGENRLVGVGPLERRLVGGRPERAGAGVADVAKRTPVVAGGVFAPARDGAILPAAVAATGIGDHHVIAAVRQQLHFRYRRVGAAQHPHWHFRAAGGGAHVGRVGGMKAKRCGVWNPFLQQESGGLKLGISLETLLHRAAPQQIAEREQAHGLMMRHERSHHGAALAALQAGRRVVNCLIHSVFSEHALIGQALQILASRFRHHHQRERGGVRRDHQIFCQPPFQSKTRHAKRPVLVVEAGVHRVVTRLRHAPGHATLIAIGDLAFHGGVAGLIEQGVVVVRHHQHRHQILEHRAAPGKQNGIAIRCREQAPEREPALLRHLPLRNGDKTGQPRFRGEQVVVAGIAPVLIDVEADHHEVTGIVIQEAVVRRGQFTRLPRQIID